MQTVSSSTRIRRMIMGASERTTRTTKEVAAARIKAEEKAAKGIELIGNAFSVKNPRLSIRIIYSVPVLTATALAETEFVTSSVTPVAVREEMIASLSMERRIPVGPRRLQTARKEAEAAVAEAVVEKEEETEEVEADQREITAIAKMPTP